MRGSSCICPGDRWVNGATQALHRLERPRCGMGQTAPARLDPIGIEDYDEGWPAFFADQQLIVTSALSDLVISIATT